MKSNGTSEHNHRRTTRQCIFCGRPGVTKTHIWPDWLKKILPKDRLAYDKQVRTVVVNQGWHTTEYKSKNRQGDLFQTRPRLACKQCNSGWMKEYEDKVLKFIIPIITGEFTGRLHFEASRIFVGWFALMVMLIEYRSSLEKTIGRDELRRFRQLGIPHPNWVTYIGRVSGSKWLKHMEYHQFLMKHRSVFDVGIPIAADGSIKCNGHVITIGIGKLLIHSASIPMGEWVYPFQQIADSFGLKQIWPPQAGLIPFTTKSFQFPATPTLDDDDASKLADAFYLRISGKAKTDWPDSIVISGRS